MLNKIQILNFIKRFDKSFCSKAKVYLLYLAIFLLAFGLRVYFISTTPFPHVDEPATYFITTPSKKDQHGNYLKQDFDNYITCFSKDLRGGDVNNYLFQPEHSIKALLDDLRLIRLQKLDRPHPSLYYAIARIWNHPLGDFDTKMYLNHLRSLNLIFFVFSFFFMYKLLSLIHKNNSFISLGLAFAFLNAGSITLVAMAREYPLQESLFILVTYLTLKLYKKMDKDALISIKESSLYALACALLISSGYFSIIYLAMLLTVLFKKAILLKNTRYILANIIAILVTIIITIILCPHYFDFKTENCHYTSIVSQIINLFNYKPEVLTNTISYLLKYLYYTTIIIFILAHHFFNILNTKSTTKETSSDYKKVALEILFIAFTWTLIVLYLTPYKCLRFIEPALPVLAIIYPLLLSNWKNFTKILLVIAYFLISFKTITTKNWVDYYDRIVDKPHLAETMYPTVIVNPSYFSFTYMFLNTPKNGIVRFEKEIPQPNYVYKKYNIICRNHTLENLKICSKRLLFNLYVYFVFYK